METTLITLFVLTSHSTAQLPQHNPNTSPRCGTVLCERVHMDNLITVIGMYAFICNFSARYPASARCPLSIILLTVICFRHNLITPIHPACKFSARRPPLSIILVRSVFLHPHNVCSVCCPPLSIILVTVICFHHNFTEHLPVH